jgi:3-dehydroquinate synthetase
MNLLPENTILSEYIWTEQDFSYLTGDKRLEETLQWPYKTIAVLRKAYLLKLNRTCSWNLSKIPISKQFPYIKAKKYYKRSIPNQDRSTLDSKIVFSFDTGINFTDNSCFFVVDKNVATLWKIPIAKNILVLDAGEKNKNLSTVAQIKLHWQQISAPRQWKLLGGGIVLDMGAFAAKLCNVSYDSYPTSLLAMVDAAVGGKNGVNFAPFGKNLLGSFYSPKQVTISSAWLKTLSDKDLICGGVECLKHSFIAKDQLLAHDIISALNNKNYEFISRLLPRLIKIKQEIVAQDPYEMKGVRQVLNYGHTLAHALEGISQDSKISEVISHGHAVAIGMLYIALLSRQEQLLDRDSVNFIYDCLKKAKSLLSIEQISFLLDSRDLKSKKFWQNVLTFIHQDKKQVQANRGISCWATILSIKKSKSLEKNFCSLYIKDEKTYAPWLETINIIKELPERIY